MKKKNQLLSIIYGLIQTPKMSCNTKQGREELIVARIKNEN